MLFLRELSIFEYHIGFSLSGLLIPVIIILAIAILTLAAKVFKAARQNPVESLKYE